MTSLAAYSKRPYVSFTERMQEQALLRQQMQNEAEQRAYTQQKNALDLAQAEENLRQAQSGFGQGIPASVQQWNFYKNIRDPKEKELYLSTIKNSGGGYAQVNLGDQIGLLNKSTGQIEQTFPKGVLPRNYVNTLGDVSTIPGISSGYGQGQGQPQAMPQPPMQQGGMPYEPNLDSQLNAMAAQGQPQLMQPPAGGMQPSMPQTVLQPPVRNPDGTYTYGGRSYRNSTAARDAYDFDLKKEEWILKNPSTEDEKKAASWLKQANFAYKNLLKSLYTEKGERTGAERPNAVEALLNSKYIPISPRIARSTKREQFVQATETIADALLRAATGAGQNEAEARRKIEEITPSWFDDDATIKQKLDSIPAYIESIKARAGRATPKNFTIPTVESVIPAVGGGLSIREQADAILKGQ